ncbi:acetyl-CoA carboxylase biotin carboxyl carrier protein subunit [Propioniciclava soli]|uniref:Acetyl-CoA carboxylase biotin carboxyl carrier protein subunit n=1 Tax=Propioniciclava soli TaxID=2775081 RepID=A0ABZ3C5Q6_9ACTN
MRRYTITVNDTTRVIDVEAVGADVFRVQLDGRLIDVTLDDHRDLAHSAVTPAVTPRPLGAGGPATAGPAADRGATAVGREPARAAVTPAPGEPPRATGAPAASGSPAPGGGGGRDKMTAPMPGVILTVDVAVGASVRRGDTLMVLEAMKMKNELKAPKDGVVAEIYVTAGHQVKFGETLVRFES